MTAMLGYVWDNLLTTGMLVRATLRGEYGQTLAEYSVILSVVAVGVITPTVIIMRGALIGAFQSATDCMSALTC